MGSLLYRHGDREWQILHEAEYENEDELQRLLTDTPNLIPVHELAGQLQGPLMTIAREAGLGSGIVDVLCLDQLGRPVVIEAKLRKNPEIRREVLAQAVSYAAHLEGLEAEQVVDTIVRPWVEQVADDADGLMSLDDCLAILGHTAPAGIEEGLARYLESGEFAVFIVVDEPHPQLRRTVSYVNSHADFDIYLVEVGYFRSEDGQEAISPRILDTSTRRKRSQRRPTFDDALAEADEDVRQVDSRLAELAEKYDLELEQTTGSRRMQTKRRTQLLSLSPRWRNVQFSLSALRDNGMASEADEIADGLGTLTDDNISPRSPTVNCGDLLASWTMFETEVFPKYLQYRITVEDAQANRD